MRWIVVAEDENALKDRTRNTLTLPDLQELCTPNSWMTDGLINYGVTVFSGNYTDQKNNVRWIAPALVKAAKDGGNDAFDASLGGVLGQPAYAIDSDHALPNNAAILLFPVNQGDTHWSLLAFVKATGKFVHFDSLSPANEEAAQALISKLIAKNYLGHALDHYLTDSKIPRPAGSRRQQDGYNCGLFVIQYARKMMESGAIPSSGEMQKITGDTCDEFRAFMLYELQPFVATELVKAAKAYDPAPTHPLPAETIEEEEQRQEREAAKKMQRQLEDNREAPVELNGIQPCPNADPTMIHVVVKSKDNSIAVVESAIVTFNIENNVVRRRGTFDKDDKTHRTKLKLQIPALYNEKLKITINVEITPKPEFVESSVSQEILVKTEQDNQVEIVIEPKPLRRLFAKFLIDDENENREKSDEEKKLRPFPKGLKLFIDFDYGAHKTEASIGNDGLLTDGIDNKVGARLPYRFERAQVRFNTQKKQYLVWDKGSAANAAVTLVDEEPGKKLPDNKQRGALLPKGSFTPRTCDEPPVWVLPKDIFVTNKTTKDRKAEAEGQDLEESDIPEQVQDNPEKIDPLILRPQIDISAGNSIGTQEAPVVYRLVKSPRNRLMNGHLIEHVVVIMLENRGFDHFMGFLYEDQPPPNSYPANGKAKGKHSGLRAFEGLVGLGLGGMKNRYDYKYEYQVTKWVQEEDSNGEKKDVAKIEVKQGHAQGECHPVRGARAANVPRTNPHEDFIHIFQDMYGLDHVPDPHLMERVSERDSRCRVNGANSPYIVPPMNGWCQNYCDGIRHHRGEKTTVLTDDMVSEIMDMYIPDQLPVMSGLARNYCVSDLWFCSVPSQTNTNRAFWGSGSAAGLVKNDFYPALTEKFSLALDQLPEGHDKNGVEFRRSLFDVLEEEKVDWKYYVSMYYPVNPVLYFTSMFPQFKGKAEKYPWLDQFYKDLESGSLPTVSYIEPSWAGGPAWEYVGGLPRVVGNEFHPVSDMTNGEFFIKNMFEKIAKSPKWDTTLFVITFDENGGTYDHLPPWEATPTGREPTTGKKTQYGFMFDCYGVRVPTLLISRHITPGTIFRSPTEVPFDHTSIISTVLEWLDIDRSKWKLGKRVAKAPTFDKVLTNAGDNQQQEDQRKKTATGFAKFDQNRIARINGKQPLNTNSTFYLKYIGTKWPNTPPNSGVYIGGPATSMFTWYPITVTDKRNALKFKFSGGAVEAGSALKIEVAEGKAKGYSLAIPSTKGATTIYLYSGGNPSKWVPWLFNDRIEGVKFFDGDEIIIFDENSLPDKMSKVQGLQYDPYQRLTVDPIPPPNPHDAQYLKWRAGEWDIWQLEQC